MNLKRVRILFHSLTKISGADVDQADRGVRQADQSGQDGDQPGGQ